jgi:hypothetical protein
VGLEVGEGFAGHGEASVVLDELTEALGVHGVVDRVLRVEVGVERGRLHADPLGDPAQRHAGQALTAGEVPRHLDDLGLGGFVSFGTSIAYRFL